MELLLYWGVVLGVIVALLTAMKFGFNQVIKGLEAASDRLDRPR